jgi:hypothetical protein
MRQMSGQKIKGMYKLCTCDVFVMAPVRIAFDAEIEHQCEHCGNYVTWIRHEFYNRYWGYAGYDIWDDKDEN